MFAFILCAADGDEIPEWLDIVWRQRNLGCRNWTYYDGRLWHCDRDLGHEGVHACADADRAPRVVWMGDCHGDRQKRIVTLAANDVLELQRSIYGL